MPLFLKPMPPPYLPHMEKEAYYNMRSKILKNVQK
jgi:hypothetical protein